MSTLNQVVLIDKDHNVENNLAWSCIEWLETEVPNAGVANAQTQTEQVSTSEAESQTNNPVIMRIDLARTHSKLRHVSLIEADGLGGPLFQFDRQALGRISTSPTLRRMRSTRRSQTDIRDPVRMESTQEEPGADQRETPPAVSPVSPVHRHILSPLAPSPLCDGAIQLDNGTRSWPNSSTGRQRTRSQRSKTFDNGISCTREESPIGAHPIDFEFPSCEGQENEQDHTRLQERRRSSVVVSIPGLDVSPGDLFVSNGAADMLNRSSFSGNTATNDGHVSYVAVSCWV